MTVYCVLNYISRSSGELAFDLRANAGLSCRVSELQVESVSNQPKQISFEIKILLIRQTLQIKTYNIYNVDFEGIAINYFIHIA